jgi:hypothetical protein
LTIGNKAPTTSNVFAVSSESALFTARTSYGATDRHRHAFGFFSKHVTNHP